MGAARVGARSCIDQEGLLTGEGRLLADDQNSVHRPCCDPLSGYVVVFLNRRGNQVPLIAWTRGGSTITHKRLERGTFTFARQLASNAKCVLIDVHDSVCCSKGSTWSGRKDPSRNANELKCLTRLPTLG